MQSIMLFLSLILVALVVTQAFVQPNSINSNKQLLTRGSSLSMGSRFAGRCCEVTEKRRNGKAMSVSKSNAHVHRQQKVNLQYFKIFWEGGNTWVRIRMAVKTKRMINKLGLEAVAKRYNLNLRRYAINRSSAPAKKEGDAPRAHELFNRARYYRREVQEGEEELMDAMAEEDAEDEE